MCIRKERLAKLNISTEWIPIEFLGEPFITVTFRGYAVAADVKVIATGLEYTLLLGAKSLAEPVERARAATTERLTGTRMAVRRSSSERTAVYEVRHIA